jgi:prepilin-type N-terminal cleavage/methylation domain-containing protein
MKVKNNKAFTLIELLAVIIILGVLMIIAIPAVTSYISDSRKNAYVDTAKEIIAATRTKVNEGKLNTYDMDATYYIPAKCIPTETGGQSPYGEFTQAYIAVVYEGNNFKYYWISNDATGQGIKDITPFNDLDKDNIIGGIKDSDILDIIETTGIEGRGKIKILKDDCKNWNTEKTATKNLGSNGVVSDVTTPTTPTGVVYPSGKDKTSVVQGEIVKIGNEEFYVLKRSGSKLYLLAHYNLKVGGIYDMNNNNNNLGSYSSSDPGFGRQSSETKGGVANEHKKGTLAFASTNYWAGNVAVPGSPYEGNYGAPYVFVYDNNSNLKSYIDSYKSYLIEQGANVTEARVMNYTEATEMGCNPSGETCSGAPQFMHETSFWLGSANGPESLWRIDSINNKFMKGDYSNYYYYGIRPLIVIE